MVTIARTATFDRWLRGLRDSRARLQIARRLDRARTGNFGDVRPVGEGISELRIDVGPGYRIYFCRVGDAVYLLLAGGSKATQRRDIHRALAMARSLTE